MEATKTQTEKFSDINKYPTLTCILREGQPYIDNPIYKNIASVKQIVKSLGACFKNYFVPQDITQLIEYRRHILKWVKPDPP